MFSFSPQFLTTYPNSLTYSAHECFFVNLQKAKFGIRIRENNKTGIQVILFQIFGINFPVYVTITRCTLRWRLGLLAHFSWFNYAYVVLHFPDEGLAVLRRDVLVGTLSVSTGPVNCVLVKNSLFWLREFEKSNLYVTVTEINLISPINMQCLEQKHVHR